MRVLGNVGMPGSAETNRVFGGPPFNFYIREEVGDEVVGDRGCVWAAAINSPDRKMEKETQKQRARGNTRGWVQFTKIGGSGEWVSRKPEAYRNLTYLIIIIALLHWMPAQWSIYLSTLSVPNWRWLISSSKSDRLFLRSNPSSNSSNGKYKRHLFCRRWHLLR